MTILLGNTSVQPFVPSLSSPSAAPRKRGWLPLLTVLFLISYGLMTLLIMEQATTIETQRVLIRDLFHDSAELSAMKGKAVRENNAQQQAKSPKDSPAQDQAQPPSQTAPQHGTQKKAGAQRPQVHVPSRPAADLSDARRALNTI